MKNILKNKLLIISVLFSIIITTMCSSVFASETTTYNYSLIYDSKNININVDDYADFSNYLVEIAERNGGYLYISVYYFNGDVSFVSRDSDFFVNIGEGGSVAYFTRSFPISDINDGKIVSFPSSGEASLRNYSFSTTIANYSERVKTYYGVGTVLDTSSNVVFQGAPQAQVAQVELMKPTQVEEILPQIIAVVEIVLPIFLGIFGVLLVLYLIKSKNLLHL